MVEKKLRGPKSQRIPNSKNNLIYGKKLCLDSLMNMIQTVMNEKAFVMNKPISVTTMVLFLLRSLGSALPESLNVTTKKSYMALSLGHVTLIVVVLAVVVPPLCVTSLPDSA